VGKAATAVAVGTGGFVTKSSGLTRLKAGGSAAACVVGWLMMLICGGARTVAVAVGWAGTAVTGLMATLATDAGWQAAKNNSKTTMTSSEERVGEFINADGLTS
jgi:hypothetical protein